MGPQEMLDRAEVKNKWAAYAAEKLQIAPSDRTYVAYSSGSVDYFCYL